MTRLRLTAGLALLLLLGSCFLDPGACNYEYRNIEFHTQLTGPLLAPGAAAVSVILQLNETRNANPSFRTLYVEFSGGVPGIDVIELRQLSATGARLLATIPTPLRLAGRKSKKILTNSRQGDTLRNERNRFRRRRPA